MISLTLCLLHPFPLPPLQADDEEDLGSEEVSHKAYFKFQGGRYQLLIPAFSPPLILHSSFFSPSSSTAPSLQYFSFNPPHQYLLTSSVFINAHYSTPPFFLLPSSTLSQILRHRDSQQCWQEAETGQRLRNCYIPNT